MSTAEALPLAALCLFALSDIGTDAEECRRQGPRGLVWWTERCCARPRRNRGDGTPDTMWQCEVVGYWCGRVDGVLVNLGRVKICQSIRDV